MHVLIYGVGGKALYLAAHLSTAGHNIDIVGNKPTATKALRNEGITLTTRQGETKSTQAIKAYDELTDSSGKDYDWIAITAPAYETAPIGYQLLEHLQQPVPIVSFQTGIGHRETLSTILNHEMVGYGTITTLLDQTSTNTVQEIKRGDIYLAPEFAGASTVIKSLSATSTPIHQLNNPQTLEWSTLFTNLIGNATSAIIGKEPSKVLQDTRLFDIEWATLQETLQIMQQANISLTNLTNYPARRLAMLIKHLPRQLLRPILIWFENQRQIQPSLLQELLAAEQKTEAAWLNGAIVSLANSHRTLAPLNHALALTVSDIAAGRVPWETFRDNPEMLLTIIDMTQGLPEGHNPD